MEKIKKISKITSGEEQNVSGEDVKGPVTIEDASKMNNSNNSKVSMNSSKSTSKVSAMASLASGGRAASKNASTTKCNKSKNSKLSTTSTSKTKFSGGSSGTNVKSKKNKKSSKKKSKKGKSKKTVEQFDNKESPIEAMGLDKAQPYNPDQEFDERQIDFSIKLIRSNLQRLSEIASTVDASDAEFKKYIFDRTVPLIGTNAKPVKARSCLSIHPAIHSDYKSTQLVCKIYDPKKYDPKKNDYLRILRHISKKHPSILGTWDVFYDGTDVLVMQELAGYGSLEQYIEHFKTFNENKAQETAKQALRAMDYLGDFGLAHRCICPRHLMVCRSKKDWTVKLSGFQSTIIYWDIEKEDIKFQPCRPTKEAEKELFQAPEVFSDSSKDVYDPIMADIFSFGTVIYYMFTAHSPVKPNKPEEIKNSLKKLDLSSTCKDILGKMLNIDSKLRLPFEQMSKHSWLREA